MLNFEAIDREINSLEKLQIRLVAAIRNAPKGTVFYRSSEKAGPVPYCSGAADPHGKRRKINVKDPNDAKLLRKLKDKKFASHALPRVRKNLQILRSAAAYRPLSRSFLIEQGEPYEDCIPRFFGRQADNDEFDMLEERQNPYHPEQMNVCDELGAFRSKNELLSAHVLDDLQLRFKYEAPRFTPYGTKYPDFTVLHPVTGELRYIEVAGRMDDPEYRRDLYEKLEAYAEAGIYSGVNLLLICIDPHKGIDLAAIRELIRGFFAL